MQQRLVSCRSSQVSYPTENASSAKFATVADVMTGGAIISCKPDTTVEEALELLVQYRITGLPVVDDKDTVVGVVSDFDLLALDTLGRVNDDNNLFPSAEQTWQAFKQVKSLLAKTGGKLVKDVMTKKPITVTPKTDLDSAAQILLNKKIRRLPVLDENGKLVGILSRSNIVKAALLTRKAAMAKQSQTA